MHEAMLIEHIGGDMGNTITGCTHDVYQLSTLDGQALFTLRLNWVHDDDEQQASAVLKKHTGLGGYDLPNCAGDFDLIAKVVTALDDALDKEDCSFHGDLFEGASGPIYRTLDVVCATLL